MMPSQQSYNLLRYALAACIVALFLACNTVAQHPKSPWENIDSILRQIVPPTFPEQRFLITDYGARGDGVTDCTEAFRKAIQACADRGGGHVVVPQGEFLTGPIHLKSNVNLHLSENSTIKFNRNPEKYLPLVFTRWEGVELMNYSPLIYAFEQENVAITGEGVLDGQASNEFWWPWKGKEEFGWEKGIPHQAEARSRLFAMGEGNAPVDERKFGEGHYLRPSFIQPYRCKNVLIEGVKIVNAPMWVIHPVLCENVTITNVRVETHGPNNDGCNPESSKNVLITECYFDTGDDCIAIKSGRNNDGRRVNTPSENIVIRGCTFRDGHGGVTIGSEVSGGARNIFAEQCDIESPVLYNALRIKTNSVRGGLIENVHLRDFEVRRVGKAAVDVDLFYEEGNTGTHVPTIQDISIRGMHVAKCSTALNLVGYVDAPLKNIRLIDCTFNDVAAGYTIKHVVGFEAANTTINGSAITQ